MLSQAQHDGLQFRATVCSLGAYGHSELDSESMEGGAGLIQMLSQAQHDGGGTDPESSSGRRFSVLGWRFAVCGACGHSELDSESVKAYNIDL